MRVDDILEKLSVEELVGQLLCFDFYGKDDPKEIERILRDIKPGGIFLQQMTAEQVKTYTQIANKYSAVPVIVAGEIEGGANKTIVELDSLPNQMALGSADDPELLEKLGRVLGNACRKGGFHWAYSPVVDINYNFMASASKGKCVQPRTSVSGGLSLIGARLRLTSSSTTGSRGSESPFSTIVTNNGQAASKTRAFGSRARIASRKACERTVAGVAITAMLSPEICESPSSQMP